jgi:superfamily I DNA and/or RNA helicase/very-short-patch-repair endonuclease
MAFSFLKTPTNSKPAQKAVIKSAQSVADSETSRKSAVAVAPKVSQIKFDLKFIEKLLAKLTVGNGQSVHLNAIPGRRKNRLDLCDLAMPQESDSIFGKEEPATSKKPKNDLPQKFIDTLLSKEKFNFTISWDGKEITKLSNESKNKLAIVSKRLDYITAENEDNFLETGVKNFGFGYPLLVKAYKNDPKKIVVAPLFIWNLDITKSNRKNEWSISKTEDSPIRVNELLVSYFEKDEGLKILKIGPEELDDGILSSDEIISYVKSLFKQLKISATDLSVGLEPCLSKDKIESIVNENAFIQWSGIFGLYRSQKEPIIESLRELEDKIDVFNEKDLVLQPFQTSTTAAFETDPSQSEIINTLHKDEFKIIQGPPGTGKSQSISAIISNSLASGAKTLVVCEKKTALDVLYKNLSNKKLNGQSLAEFCVVIDDVNRDRRHVVEKARNIQDNNWTRGFRDFDAERFKYKCDLFVKLRDKINWLYNESSRPIFGKETFQNIVGKFIKNSDSQHFHKFKYMLNDIDFEFSPIELANYKHLISEGARLKELCKDINESDFILIDFADYPDGIGFKETKGITDKIAETITAANEMIEHIGKNKGLYNPNVSMFAQPKKATYIIELVDSGTKIYEELKSTYKKELPPEQVKKLTELLSDFGKISEDANKRFGNKYTDFDIDETAHTKIKQLDEVIAACKEIKELYDEGVSIIGDKFNDKNIGFVSRLFNKNAQSAHDILNKIERLFEDIKKLSQSAKVSDKTKDWSEYEQISKCLTDLNKISKTATDNRSAVYESLATVYKQSQKQQAALADIKTQCENIIECHNLIIAANEFIKNQFPKLDFKYRTPVKSSNIKTIWYDNGVLEVEFHNSGIYRYVDVPAEIHQQFMSAESHGQFFNQNIMSKYRNVESAKSKTEENPVDTYLDKLRLIISKLTYLDSKSELLGTYSKYVTFRDFGEVKDVLTSLETIDTEEWDKVFTAAYYNGLLMKFLEDSKVGLPNAADTPSELTSLQKLHKDLQQETIKKIYDHWIARRDIAIRELEDNYGFKALFALKKNKQFGKRLSLRQIIEKDFTAFTDLFPVIMVNPIVANALFPLKPGLFNLVIFDEASQLRIEDVYTSMIRGQYKIIAGDKHQMPPSDWFATSISANLDNDETEDDEDSLRKGMQLDAESLLVFAETLKYKNESYLDFHYRSRHPGLINFSNAGIYGGNLCPLPVHGEDYTPIILKEVNGVYEGGKGQERINKQEAVEALKIIAELRPDEDGEMPSVGIATFNISQRNLIWGMLYEAAADNSDFKEKFLKLQQSGLFVKNLENIQGDERDIIIISTTYGPDETGKFKESLGPVIRENGYKLLNVLVTRAKKQLYVVTSIPSAKYSNYKEILENQKEKNSRHGFLYAYIAYAKAISDNDCEAIKSILSNLRQSSHDQPRHVNMSDDTGLSESPFEEEVYDEIIKIFPKESITQQHWVGGYRLDFLLKLKGYNIALECDGKAYHASEQAYAEDMHRQKQLEQLGFVFHRIWSSDWWNNKDKEIQKLRKFVEGLK